MRCGCKSVESTAVSLQNGDLESAAAAAAVVSSNLLPRWARPQPHRDMSLGLAQVIAETRATGRSWRPSHVTPQSLQMAAAISSLHAFQWNCWQLRWQQAGLCLSVHTCP